MGENCGSGLTAFGFGACVVGVCLRRRRRRRLTATTATTTLIIRNVGDGKDDDGDSDDDDADDDCAVDDNATQQTQNTLGRHNATQQTQNATTMQHIKDKHTTQITHHTRYQQMPHIAHQQSHITQHTPATTTRQHKTSTNITQHTPAQRITQGTFMHAVGGGRVGATAEGAHLITCVLLRSGCIQKSLSSSSSSVVVVGRRWSSSLSSSSASASSSASSSLHIAVWAR